MKRFFEGWYYKQQASGKTLAFIPGRTSDSAFVQIVTNEFSRNITYPLSDYHKSRDGLCVGGSVFSSSGVTLDVRDGAFALSGHLRYGPLTPLRSDIMGPFRFFPMECRHGIVSMRHSVMGTIILSGELLDFTDGVGYIESDSGRSFPKGYTWVQCNDFSGSIFASAARIPFLGRFFRGCIAVVWLDGREYRLATYSGARILRSEPDGLTIRQGRLLLEITVRPDPGHPLAAPEDGVMQRTIYENASCPARFRLLCGDVLLLDAESRHASYEYVPANALADILSQGCM